MHSRLVTGARTKKATSTGKENGVTFWKMAHKLALKTEYQRMESIREGMDSAWLFALSKAFHLNRQTLAAITNLSESTLDRRQKNRTPLDSVASERLDRIAQVAVLAESVLEDKEVAAKWMAASNDALGGKSPLSLCDTELGARQVRRVLHAIEWGGVA